MNNDLYSYGILRKYHTVKKELILKPKTLSNKKLELCKDGLPKYFKDDNSSTIGKIFINNNGDIVVSFSIVNGNKNDENDQIYLIDVNDNILKNVK